jgi:hypothetical protein
VGTRRLTCGQPASQAPFAQVSPNVKTSLSYLDSDQRKCVNVGSACVAGEAYALWGFWSAAKFLVVRYVVGSGEGAPCRGGGAGCWLGELLVGRIEMRDPAAL